MYSSELVLALTSLGMEGEYAKVRASSNNIGSANLVNAPYYQVNFQSLIANLQQAIEEGDSSQLNQVLGRPVELETVPNQNISIDNEVAVMLLAEGRFKVMAEIYQRQLGLKQIAYSGVR